MRKLTAFVFYLLVLTDAIAVQAGVFGVYTYAHGGGQGAGASATYNTRDGGSFGDSIHPSNTSISNPTDTYMGSSVSGLTSAYSQTTQSAAAGFGPVSSSDYGAADLATGTLHAYTFSTPVYDSFAGAELFDTLRFNIAGASDSTTTTIHVQFNVDGTTTDLSESRDAAIELYNGGVTGFIGNNPYPTLGNAAANWAWSEGQSTGFIPGASSLVSWSVSAYTPTTFSVDGTVTLTGANPVLGLAAALDVFAGGFFDSNGNPVDVTQDYSNTASISISLPSNASFTSDSGVFLTGQGGVAPEPAAMVQWLFALGILPVLRRGRCAISRQERKLKTKLGCVRIR